MAERMLSVANCSSCEVAEAVGPGLDSIPASRSRRDTTTAGVDLRARGLYMYCELRMRSSEGGQSMRDALRFELSLL